MTTTLRKALERLSAAALARDSTMGDPCALLAAKAELADANKAACAALAAPQPEPVAYVPRCHTDGNYCIVGEYKWDEIEEKPFGLADPAHWECAALYAAPPAAPAPADWGTPHDVSGAPGGAPAPAVCDGGTCGLGGYCTNCPRLSAAPAVREPQDERIRWRDAVIKEAESALRTAEQEFADMPTWANVGHAAKKVTHALAVIAALGIGGGAS